jgi:hypothetical protein
MNFLDDSNHIRYQTLWNSGLDSTDVLYCFEPKSSNEDEETTKWRNYKDKVWRALITSLARRELSENCALNERWMVHHPTS